MKIKIWQIVVVILALGVMVTYPLLAAIIIPIGIIIFGVNLNNLKNQTKNNKIETQIKQSDNKIARTSYTPVKKEPPLFVTNRINLFNELLASIPRVQISINKEIIHEKFNVKEFYHNFNKLQASTNLNRLLNFVVVDVETTGTVALPNSITQVTAIRFENFNPTEMFSTYINPKKPIPEQVIKINGITDDMVKDSPEFEWIIDSLDEFVGKSTMVGHNLIFDMKFLYKNGYNFLKDKRFYFDTLEISRIVDKEAYDHKLVTLCNREGIHFDSAHNSEYDALATGLLFNAYIDEKIQIDTIQYPYIKNYFYGKLIEESTTV